MYFWNFDLPYTPPPYPTPETPQTKKTFHWVGISVLLLTLGMTVLQLVLEVLLRQFGGPYATTWWASWLLAIVPLYGFGLPIMFLILQKVPVVPHNQSYQLCRTKPNEELLSCEKPRFTFVNWLIVLGIGFGCMFVGSIMGNYAMAILSLVTGCDYESVLLSMMDDSPLWATFIGTCVIAPLGEEFIFRKLLIDRTRQVGDVPAIFFSGVIFGLFHGNLYQLFYATMLGVLLAYIYTRTNNIWPCVGLHATVNLLGAILLPELTERIDLDALAMPSISWGFAISIILLSVTYMIEYTAIAGGVVLGVLRHKRRVLAPSPDGRPIKFIARDIVTSPGVLAAVIVLVLMILLSLAIPLLQMIVDSIYQSI